MSSPFALNGKKVEKIRIASIKGRESARKQSSFIFCKNLHLWKSKSLREKY